MAGQCKTQPFILYGLGFLRENSEVSKIVSKFVVLLIVSVSSIAAGYLNTKIDNLYI